MKDQKTKKVPLPLKVPEALFNEIDQEAKEKGIPRSDVALYRLQHYPIPLTPELMVELQDAGISKYEELKPDQPQETIKIQKRGYEFMETFKVILHTDGDDKCLRNVVTTLSEKISF